MSRTFTVTVKIQSMDQSYDFKNMTDSKTIRDLKMMITQTLQYSFEEIILAGNAGQLDNSKTLRACGITKSKVIYMMNRTQNSRTVVIRAPQDLTFSIKIFAEDKGKDLAERIKIQTHSESIPTLSFNGRVIEAEENLFRLGITNNSAIEVLTTVIGGSDNL